MDGIDEAEKKLRRTIAVLRDEHLLPELAFDLSSVAAVLLVYIDRLEKVEKAARGVIKYAVVELDANDIEEQWCALRREDYRTLEATLAALEKRE